MRRNATSPPPSHISLKRPHHPGRSPRQLRSNVLTELCPASTRSPPATASSVIPLVPFARHTASRHLTGRLSSCATEWMHDLESSVRMCVPLSPNSSSLRREKSHVERLRGASVMATIPPCEHLLSAMGVAVRSGWHTVTLPVSFVTSLCAGVGSGRMICDAFPRGNIGRMSAAR